MDGQKRSNIWIHFSIVSDDKAKCNICKNTYSYKGGSSTNLKKHLKSKHPTVILNLEEPTEKRFKDSDPKTVHEKPNNESESHRNVGIKVGSNDQPNTSEDGGGSSQVRIGNTTTKSQRQSTLKGFISKPISLPRQKKINDLVLNMMVYDLQPFSIVGDRGFTELLRELEPSYMIPSRPTFSKSLLPAKYDEKSNRLKELLKTADYVTLSTDSWTSINTEGYTAVTAHFITDEWKFYGCLLTCFKYDGRHTADNIAQELERVAKDWDITEKVYAIATDNAANMIAGIRTSGHVHIPCFAHTINLIVRDGIQQILELQIKIKKIVEYFHRSSQAAAKLVSTQAQMNPNSTPLKLIKDVQTRWNSTYFMFERVVTLCEPLTATVAVLHNPVNLPTEEEWTILKDLCIILKPFDGVTVEMSSEKQVTLSKVILIVKGLLSSLNKNKVNLKSQTGVKLLDFLMAEITSRFGNPEANNTMGKATFLDPRFKARAFSNEGCLRRVKEKIQEEIVSLIKKKEREAPTIFENEVDSSQPSNDNNENDLIWQDFDRIVETSKTTQISPTAIAISEIRMYTEENNLDRKKDPLIWWADRQKIYPWLSKLAQKHLSIVATSVPCERVFSKAGQVVTERRNRLKSKNVEQILFLHCNRDL